MPCIGPPHCPVLQEYCRQVTLITCQLVSMVSTGTDGARFGLQALYRSCVNHMGSMLDSRAAASPEVPSCSHAHVCGIGCLSGAISVRIFMGHTGFLTISNIAAGECSRPHNKHHGMGRRPRL